MISDEMRRKPARNQKEKPLDYSSQSMYNGTFGCTFRETGRQRSNYHEGVFFCQEALC
jgi:hypothetical protein